MLTYLTLGTNDLPRARAFYAATLATLGIAPIQDSASETGFGRPGDADPSLYVTIPYDNQPATHGNGTMVALTAATRAEVRAFHAAALANGGRDEGAPGLRYAANFYSCYVRDPDGNKLSAEMRMPSAHRHRPVFLAVGHVHTVPRQCLTVKHYHITRTDHQTSVQAMPPRGPSSNRAVG
jgi:catechol 2,3-dioxygenase-like lactoylglutathione lyase family enzyme